MKSAGSVPRWVPFALFAGAAVVVLLAWRNLWFLTDDAFLAFRYVSNSQLGLGYVWNPPPFRPVEGYTSFLWVVLLDFVWRFLGCEPPIAANRLALLFSIGTLALATYLAWRLAGRGPLRGVRVPVTLLVLLGITTNRTFLFATSSGLETALQNALCLGWLTLALLPPEGRSGGLLLSTSALLVSLGRPDGLVYVLATLPLIALLRYERGVPLWTAAPLLGTFVHLAFRRSFYGEWLPNTYFAKVVRPWPEAGVRYLASFVLELCLWLPALLVGAAVAVWLARLPRWLGEAPAGERLALARRSVAVAAPLAVAGYYTFVVGGDYFEYRPYSGLVPVVFLASLWAAARLSTRPWFAVASLGAVVLASGLLPWTHFRVQEREFRLFTREQPPVAPHVPAILRGYVSAHDRLQEWLAARMICKRYHLHRAFLANRRERAGTRESWSRRLEPQRGLFPAHDDYAAGYVAWILAEAVVIDRHGLNDRSIARGRVDTPNASRRLGHDRTPVPGYAECFRPNVELQAGRVRARVPALTPADIVACEAEFDPERPSIRPLVTLDEPVPIGGRSGTLRTRWRGTPDLSSPAVRETPLAHVLNPPPEKRVVDGFGEACTRSRPDGFARRRFETVLSVPSPGVYRFRVETDDDGSFFLNGREVFSTTTAAPRFFHVEFRKAGGYRIGIEASNEAGSTCAEVAFGPAGSARLEPLPKESCFVPVEDQGVERDRPVWGEGTPAPPVPPRELARLSRTMPDFQTLCGAGSVEALLNLPVAGSWGLRLHTRGSGRLFLGGLLVLETTASVARDVTLEIAEPGGHRLVLEVEGSSASRSGPSEGSGCVVLSLRGPGSRAFAPVQPGQLLVPPGGPEERTSQRDQKP